MSNHHQRETERTSISLPCDKRYRNSRYFLEDQLRCSDAAADFRSVKALIEKAASFNTQNAFQFQAETVPIHIQGN